MIQGRVWLNMFLFLSAILFCGLLATIFGKELCWDLANYHYYNSYAFFNSREQIDYWPVTFIHQYLNPLIDFLPYFLINHFSSFTVEFLLGMLHGVNFFLLFLIARSFSDFGISDYFAFSIALLGMYGPFALTGIGSFQNDNFAASFVLGFVLLQLLSFKNNSWFLFLLSCLLLGMSMGLKFTSAVYIVGEAIALICLPALSSESCDSISFFKKEKTKFILLFLLGVSIGLLLSSGFWLMKLWKEHANPFFPFLNSWFQSPDFPSINWKDFRFMPKGWMENLFFPYFFSWHGHNETQPCTDFRFAIAYSLFVLFISRQIYKRNWQQLLVINSQNQMVHWFIYFFIFSYIAWQYYFANLRYIVGLEMLCPLLIYILLKKLIHNEYYFYFSLLGSYLFIIILMFPCPMIRAPWYEGTFFNIELPASVNSINKALVLIPFSAFSIDINPRPQSYLIPFFPKGWQFVGIPFSHYEYLYENKYDFKIRSLIQHFDANIYLLSSEESLNTLYQVASGFGMKPAGLCEKIVSDRQRITHLDVYLCPVKHV